MQSVEPSHTHAQNFYLSAVLHIDRRGRGRVHRVSTHQCSFPTGARTYNFYLLKIRKYQHDDFIWNCRMLHWRHLEYISAENVMWHAPLFLRRARCMPQRNLIGLRVRAHASDRASGFKKSQLLYIYELGSV